MGLRRYTTFGRSKHATDISSP